MNHNHLIYDENAPLLKKWVSGFGLRDDNLKANNAVSSLIQVGINCKTKKEDVYDKVMK